MSGRIVGGRQEPDHGSRRADAMMRVKAWLLAHPTGGAYTQVAAAMGLSVNRVWNAALDLHLFDPDLIVSIPAPRNHYALRADWASALLGEGNQARHNATRLERQSVRFDKIADEYERRGDVMAATFVRSAARNMRNQAAELRALAEAFDRDA